ncbi:MAG: putative immunity protein [Myxococcota bacterium]
MQAARLLELLSPPDAIPDSPGERRLLLEALMRIEHSHRRLFTIADATDPDRLQVAWLCGVLSGFLPAISDALPGDERAARILQSIDADQPPADSTLDHLADVRRTLAGVPRRLRSPAALTVDAITTLARWRLGQPSSPREPADLVLRPLLQVVRARAPNIIRDRMAFEAEERFLDERDQRARQAFGDDAMADLSAEDRRTLIGVLTQPTIGKVYDWTLLKLAVGERAERHARLLAADYAERILPIYESTYPNDSRLREGLAASRRFALDDIDEWSLMATRGEAKQAMTQDGQRSLLTRLYNGTPAAVAAMAVWEACRATNPRKMLARTANTAAMAVSRADGDAEEERRWQRSHRDQRLTSLMTNKILQFPG